MHDRNTWNDFLLSQPSQTGIFLQSWEWLDFQATMERKIWRLGINATGQQDNTCGGMWNSEDAVASGQELSVFAKGTNMAE